MPHRELADFVPPDGSAQVVALTGAGISASAGLGTFRGTGGLWTASPDLEEALHARYLPHNVSLLWRVWGSLRARARRAGPTAAHRALAATGTTVITQNVDGLHQDAGSRLVHEVHGSAARARCLDPSCGYHGGLAWDEDAEIPLCPRCGSALRPDLVLFGEPLDPRVWHEAEHAARSCDVFLAIGTSAFVTPAKWLAPIAAACGALTVSINLDPHRPVDDSFDEHIVGDADSVLSRWAAQTALRPDC